MWVKLKLYIGTLDLSLIFFFFFNLFCKEQDFEVKILS